MRLSKDAVKMFDFLKKYPNQWHTYAHDAKTLQALGKLYFCRGLGIRGLYFNRQTSQMYLDEKVFKSGLTGGK